MWASNPQLAYTTCATVAMLTFVASQQGWTSPGASLCAVAMLPSAMHPSGHCCIQAQELSVSFTLNHFSVSMFEQSFGVLNKYWIVKWDWFIYLINKTWAGYKSKKRNTSEGVASQCAQVRVFGRQAVLKKRHFSNYRTLWMVTENI